jgi:sulfonate transport system substrate-binding protein
MTMRQYLKAAIFVLAALAIGATSTANPAPAGPAAVRIGLPSALGPNGRQTGALMVGLTGGFLNKELGTGGPSIEWVNIGSAGPGINEAFAGGSIDFAYYGDFPAIIGLAGGLKFKLIVPGTRGNDSYLVVPPNSTARSISELKGKRLAIHKGRPWNLAFARLLAANNLQEDEFQIFNLNPSDGDAALASHNLDAMYSTDGYLAEDRGFGKIIWSTRTAPLDWRYTAELWVTDSFADQYPEITGRVAKAYVETAYYISKPQHRDEILHDVISASAPYDVVLREYQGVPLKAHWVPVIDPFIRDHYRQAIGYALQARLIRKNLTADDFIDDRFDSQALKELNLQNYWPPVDGGGKPITGSLQAAK